MKNRSPIAVLILSTITCGIYSLFWFHWTQEELKQRGAEIPSFLLMFVPIANIYWLWKWAEGVERGTNGAMSGSSAFWLTFLLGVIGYAIVQDRFNGTGQPRVAMA